MIQITDKRKCCGCEACVQVCPKECVSMIRDAEGFFYPKANATNCIDCGLCEKVCPVLNQYEIQQPKHVYAAINPNDSVRSKSSSGGIFTLLAESVVSKGGVVFGARFDDRWHVVIDYSETVEGIKPFQGSKYLQAKVNGSYKQCRKFLEEGRIILFSGTPCQIAGLHHYLRKSYSNLLSVEVICHGVSSLTVWEKYLNETLTKGLIGRGRAQKNGNRIMLVYPHLKNAFMRAYLSDLISRPSCSACPAKSGRSRADITLADFWGIERVNPSMFDDKGTSMVMVHTEKGLQTIPFEKINYCESDLSALRYNVSYSQSAIAHKRREDFFERLEKADNIYYLINRTLRPTLGQRLDMLKHPLSYTKSMAYDILQPVLKPSPKPTGGGIYLRGNAIS